MTHVTPAPRLIPETAPFSPEQRNWLDGFFAAYLSIESGVTAVVLETDGALASAPDAADGEAPWHDQAPPLHAGM
jgi:sulfite reductase (NADPH) flavoprotein alpha-component